MTNVNSVSTDWSRFAIGEDVLWHHETRGGYGYVIHSKGKVTGIGKKRIRISVELATGGQWKEVWVEAYRLRLPSEPCMVPVCEFARRRTQERRSDGA